MSVISRILRPGVEVSVHMTMPGRGGTGMLARSGRIEGNHFGDMGRSAVNLTPIEMEAIGFGVASYLALWIDGEVEGVCQVLQPGPVNIGHILVIQPGRLRVRYG